MNTAITKRITSIDLLRGLIMIIMALDHTRDYFNADAFLFDPLDLGKTSVSLFFTRWITHFCAPIFILLAGTSAFLSGRQKTKKELAVFLIKRGFWLIFLEMTVVNFSWFFNLHFSIFLFGVIWIIGVAMIFLAGFIFLPRRVTLAIALILIFGHNLLDGMHVPAHDAGGFLWGLVHDRKLFFIGCTTFMEGYLIIPWVGVMALGYCLGEIFDKGYDPLKRKKMLLRIGSASIVLFLIVRGINVYGNLNPWTEQPSVIREILSFINVTKYPPSLDYLLVTEGFAFIFLGLTENIANRFTKIISVFGRVPMFYYLIHIYIIHLLALVAASLTGYNWTDFTNLSTWVTDNPKLKGYGFGLGIVYLVWIGLILFLYPLCKWYDRYKLQHKGKWWLSYL